MVVEIISVGTELLLGNIVNTNTAYLAKKCAGLGLSCYHQTVVGDNPKRLEDTFKQAYDRSDVVILGGGLGPTNDDLTKETVAKVMGLKLVEDKETLESIKAHFVKIGWKDIPDNNWKQALAPEGAIVVANSNGTAPGLIIPKDGKHVILMPGPPNEMIPMFEHDIEPYLRSLSDKILCSKMLKLVGTGESKAADMIKDILDTQTNPTVAPYAKTGQVHFRVTAMADSEEAGEELLKPMIDKLYERFGNMIYTTDEDETLEEVVVKLLSKKGLTITTAESCTGGLIGSMLVNVPGVSSVYKEGYITYSNEAKGKLLGVSEDTLSEYGAVSAETAKEMAEGGAKVSGADVCVAVTGIAGPEGGTAEKPVGLVYMACSYNGKTVVEKHNFSGNRQKVRDNSVVKALDLVRRMVAEV
ncbi:MAG: competence/damage-inducible protein A [Lachnospiraceae bacterium]|nr:competence/damage-inducible protein A [Lachnospiraceae bacterium]